MYHILYSDWQYISCNFFYSRSDVISPVMLLSFEGKWKVLSFMIQEITRKSLMTIKETFNSVSMVFKKTYQFIFTRARFISLITSTLSSNNALVAQFYILSTISIWNQKRRLVMRVWFASWYWSTLFLLRWWFRWIVKLLYIWNLFIYFLFVNIIVFIHTDCTSLIATLVYYITRII